MALLVIVPATAAVGYSIFKCCAGSNPPPPEVLIPIVPVPVKEEPPKKKEVQQIVQLPPPQFKKSVPLKYLRILCVGLQKSGKSAFVSSVANTNVRQKLPANAIGSGNTSVTLHVSSCRRTIPFGALLTHTPGFKEKGEDQFFQCLLNYCVSQSKEDATKLEEKAHFFNNNTPYSPLQDQTYEFDGVAVFVEANTLLAAVAKGNFEGTRTGLLLKHLSDRQVPHLLVVSKYDIVAKPSDIATIKNYCGAKYAYELLQNYNYDDAPLDENLNIENSVANVFKSMKLLH